MRFCCEEAESLDHLFLYCPYVACFQYLPGANPADTVALLGDLKSKSINNIIILLAKKQFSIYNL
jgi:hypothetical protein